MEKIIEIKQLSKYFGSQMILDELDFQLTEPKIIALVAPNGTGKTTLLNIITNLENSDEGSVTLFGRSNKDEQIFKDIAFLQDNSILYEQLSGWDHLNFVANEHQITHEEALQLVEELKMTHYMKKRVGSYSMGMKQHLLLALALISKPKLILMDEPLNGLDPSSIIQVRAIMKKQLQKGTAIMVSSHNLFEIEKVTDDVYFLINGKLTNKNSLIAEQSEYELVVDKAEKMTKLFCSLDISFQQLSSYKFEFSASQKQIEQLTHRSQEEDITIFDLHLGVGNLEAIYFNVFSDKAEIESSTYEV